MTKQTVSNWEIENVTPALDMFLSIARFFDTTPNYLLGYEVYAGVDVTGLTENEISHIMLLIDDLKAHHPKAE